MASDEHGLFATAFCDSARTEKFHGESDEPYAKRRLLRQCDDMAARDLHPFKIFDIGMDAEDEEARLKTQSQAIKPLLIHRDVPRDGNCFFHCIDYFSPRGIAKWRSDLADEFIAHRALYIDYFAGEDSFQTHIKGVLSNAWGDAYDGKAAANVLGRPILIFHKDSEQDPVIQLPRRRLFNEGPIYLLLDESNVGCEHYSLLLPPQSDTSDSSKQHDLRLAIAAERLAEVLEATIEVVTDPKMAGVFHKIVQDKAWSRAAKLLPPGNCSIVERRLCSYCFNSIEARRPSEPMIREERSKT